MMAISIRTKRSSMGARKRTSSDSQALLRRCRGTSKWPGPQWKKTSPSEFILAVTGPRSILEDLRNELEAWLLEKAKVHGEKSSKPAGIHADLSIVLPSRISTPSPSPTETSSK